MHRITRLVGGVFFKDITRLNKVLYLRSILFEPLNICTSKSSLGYFSGRGIFRSQTTCRKLCHVHKVTCWKCSYSYQDSVNGETPFFCSFCGVVQEARTDRTYFDIMNCKQIFDLDSKQLTQQFRNLQSQLHPDKFSLKSETEQNLSSLQSSLVNEAYQVLLKPLARGLYLLKLQGMSIEEGTVGNNVEFLSEIMEMNETLENGSDDMLRKLKSQTEGNLELCTKKASEAFDKEDFVAAKEILSKMKYYDNISEQIREKMM